MLKNNCANIINITEKNVSLKSIDVKYACSCLHMCKI